MRWTPLLAALLLAPASSLQAQREEPSPVALGVSVSTIGIGPELSLHFSPRFGLRSGFHYFSLSVTEEVEGVQYDIHPDWRNLTALADLHPFANAFRLTGGFVIWNTSADGNAVLSEPVTLGNTEYQPSEVGALLGKAEYSRSIAPMFGLGFAGRGRFAVTFDLGVVVAGHPKVNLNVDSPLTGAALQQLLADVHQEQLDVQQQIDDEPLARLYPVVSLGFKLRF